MFVCEKCKGSNIHILAWIDANTLEYRSEGPNEEQDKWCDDCKEHVEFKEIRK